MTTYLPTILYSFFRPHTKIFNLSVLQLQYIAPYFISLQLLTKAVTSYHFKTVANFNSFNSRKNVDLSVEAIPLGKMRANLFFFFLKSSLSQTLKRLLSLYWVHLLQCDKDMMNFKKCAGSLYSNTVKRSSKMD